MAELVLVDTSVWIDFFRGREPVYSALDKLARGGSVAIVRMVLAELLQGVKSKREISVIKELADVAAVLDEAADSWERAGLLANAVRQAGNTVGLGDCYIAVMAVSHGASLYALDKHFETLARHIDLRLYESSGRG